MVTCQYMILKGVAFASVYIKKHNEEKHIQTCGMMLVFSEYSSLPLMDRVYEKREDAM